LTEDFLELQRYVDRLETLIGACVVMFVIGLIGLFWLIFVDREDD
jgi:hypothetical protein